MHSMAARGRAFAKNFSAASKRCSFAWYGLARISAQYSDSRSPRSSLARLHVSGSNGRRRRNAFFSANVQDESMVLSTQGHLFFQNRLHTNPAMHCFVQALSAL